MNEVFSLGRTKIIIDLENLHSITTLGHKRKMLEHLILSLKFESTSLISIMKYVQFTKVKKLFPSKTFDLNLF